MGIPISMKRIDLLSSMLRITVHVFRQYFDRDCVCCPSIKIWYRRSDYKKELLLWSKVNQVFLLCCSVLRIKTSMESPTSSGSDLRMSKYEIIRAATIEVVDDEGSEGMYGGREVGEEVLMLLKTVWTITAG